MCDNYAQWPPIEDWIRALFPNLPPAEYRETSRMTPRIMSSVQQGLGVQEQEVFGKIAEARSKLLRTELLVQLHRLGC